MKPKQLGPIHRSTYSPIPTYTHPHPTHMQPPSTHTFPHTHFHTWPSSDICTTPFPFPFHQRLPTRSHRRFPAQTYGQVTPRGVRVNARSWPLNEPSSLCVCRVPKRRHQRPASRRDFSHSDVRFWGCAPRGEKGKGKGSIMWCVSARPEVVPTGQPALPRPLLGFQNES